MVIIVDYKLGNLFSVQKAFESIGAQARVSSDAADIKLASHIVLPGVGAFKRGMKNLESAHLIELLAEEVLINKKPFLGICLGMQLLADKSFEHGEYPGMGWIHGEVKKLNVETKNLKIPHIGWNNLDFKKDSVLLENIKQDSDFYFVHSYQLHCVETETVVATTSYGEEITAIVEQGNIFAVQFHPEKSQDAGMKLLENFFRHA